MDKNINSSKNVEYSIDFFTKVNVFMVFRLLIEKNRNYPIGKKVNGLNYYFQENTIARHE